MRLFPWLRRFPQQLAAASRSRRGPSRGRQTKRTRRLGWESLEDRRVLAGHLAVTSVPSANAAYRISYAVDGVEVSASNLTIGPGVTSGSYHYVSAGGWYDETTGLHNFSVEGTVTNANAILTLGISTRRDTEKSQVLANVRRTGSTAQALTVNLTSGDRTEAMVPASVTIPAGPSSRLFYIQLPQDNEYDGRQTVTLSASASGYSPAQNTLDVEDTPLGSFLISEIGGASTSKAMAPRSSRN